jgi:hypothetical protein
VNIVTKTKYSTYVLTLKLNTEKFQEDIINKRLEIARNISNGLTNKVLKRYKLMLESRAYNATKNKLKKANKYRKELYKKLNQVYLKMEFIDTNGEYEGNCRRSLNRISSSKH